MTQDNKQELGNKEVEVKEINYESKNERLNTYTMIEESGRIIKVSETKKQNKTRLTIVTENEVFFQVYIPLNIEIPVNSKINVSGNYTDNQGEDGKVYHSIFINAHQKGHSLTVITESENLLETAQ